MDKNPEKEDPCAGCQIGDAKCARPSNACATGCSPKRAMCCSKESISFLVIIMGIAFLLRGLGVLTEKFVDVLWPLLLILAGFSHMRKGHCAQCPEK